MKQTTILNFFHCKEIMHETVKQDTPIMADEDGDYIDIIEDGSSEVEGDDNESESQ